MPDINKKVLSNEAKAFTSSSSQSAAFGSLTTKIRLVATQDCHVRFAASPTATSSDMLLPAGIPEVFQVTPGEKVGVIRSSADGVLHVTQLTS